MDIDKEIFALVWTSLVIWLMSSVPSALCQNVDSITETPETILSYQELLDVMATFEGEAFELDEVTVRFDEEKDSRFIYHQDSADYALIDTIIIEANISLTNINFEWSDEHRLGFCKVHFLKAVEIQPTPESSTPRFRDCKFESFFQFTGQYVDIDMNEKTRGYFYRCHFYSSAIITNGSDYLKIDHCEFYANNRPFPEESIQWGLGMENLKGELRVDDSYFEGGIETDFLAIVVPAINKVHLFDNKFLVDVRVPEQTIPDFSFRGNEFKGWVDLTNLDFGYPKSEFDFRSISKKITVYAKTGDYLWYPDSLGAFADSIAAQRFFAVYRKITEYYRYRGNRKDYNASFIEMKEYETMSLHYDYQQDPTLANWFSWQMNQFLGTFSDYGTTPVKAILYALRVILYFAILFFFFHNDWDQFTRDKLIRQMNTLIRYFRSEAELASFYSQTSNSQYKNYDELYQYLREGEKEVPMIFTWLARPLYEISTTRTRAIRSLLKRAELLNGKWNALEKGKKIRASFWVGIWIFVYILLALIFKALNALTLSINSFTTLGFGGIPTRGIARYAAIVEGFLG